MLRAMAPGEAGASAAYGGMTGSPSGLTMGGQLPFMQMPQLSPNQLMAAQMGGGRGFTPATNPYAGMFPGGFMPNPEQTRTLGAFQQQMGGMGPMQGPNAKMGGPQATPMGNMGWGQLDPSMGRPPTGGIMADYGNGSMLPGQQQRQPNPQAVADMLQRQAQRFPAPQPQVSSWSSQGQAPARLPFTPWRGPGMGTSGMGGT